jgi:hypothetical protein
MGWPLAIVPLVAVGVLVTLSALAASTAAYQAHLLSEQAVKNIFEMIRNAFSRATVAPGPALISFEPTYREYERVRGRSR